MNYEQKYKEALERAKKLYEQGTITESLGYVFPELTEDEDERIRKGLIKAVSRIIEGHKLFDTDVIREEALAWLEKQGEQKPTEDVKTLDADKVIEWLNENVADFWRNPCNPNRVVNQFKKDFGL